MNLIAVISVINHGGSVIKNQGNVAPNSLSVEIKGSADKLLNTIVAGIS